MGTGAGLFEIKKIGDEYFTFVTECKDPKACTILLRGASKEILAVRDKLPLMHKENGKTSLLWQKRLIFRQSVTRQDDLILMVSCYAQCFIVEPNSVDDVRLSLSLRRWSVTCRMQCRCVVTCYWTHLYSLEAGRWRWPCPRG